MTRKQADNARQTNDSTVKRAGGSGAPLAATASAKNMLKELRMIQKPDSGIVPTAAPRHAKHREGQPPTNAQPPTQTIANLINNKQQVPAANNNPASFSQTQNFKTLSAIEQISAKST